MINSCTYSLWDLNFCVIAKLALLTMTQKKRTSVFTPYTYDNSTSSNLERHNIFLAETLLIYSYLNQLTPYNCTHSFSLSPSLLSPSLYLAIPFLSRPLAASLSSLILFPPFSLPPSLSLSPLLPLYSQYVPCDLSLHHTLSLYLTLLLSLSYSLTPFSLSLLSFCLPF